MKLNSWIHLLTIAWKPCWTSYCWNLSWAIHVLKCWQKGSKLCCYKPSFFPPIKTITSWRCTGRSLVFVTAAQIWSAFNYIYYANCIYTTLNDINCSAIELDIGGFILKTAGYCWGGSCTHYSLRFSALDLQRWNLMWSTAVTANLTQCSAWRVFSAHHCSKEYLFKLP